MARSSETIYPLAANGYELLEKIGDGVRTTVHRARCIIRDEIVAIKIWNPEKSMKDLETLRKQVHLMTLVNHPNLLRAHCSFIYESSLWIVTPYMSGGSCLNIMKSFYPKGLQQRIIATLLREVLRALVYLHGKGHTHHAVKVGNILVDSKGTVKLGDFGVLSTNTVFGSPSWMPPEVMQKVSRVDIWSFGITALELAQGHAPYSKNPPMRMMQSFKELVAACLATAPDRRPTAANLLKHPFFEHAFCTQDLPSKLLDGLSPLKERYRKLKEEDAKLDGNKDPTVENINPHIPREVSFLQQRKVTSSSEMRFPLDAKGYKLFEEIGVGVRATVYRARCIIRDEIVAIKIWNPEKCMEDLETIRKQVDLMSLIDHPNLLSAHCSFIHGNNLWIVTPYMSGGSCFDIMKSVCREGLEQPVIANFLREVLKALVCLHKQGYIHHDVKARNILVDSKGTVKLGDFGILYMNTVVGYPCWMPPEVVQQVDRVDIWSFGITALELAHGHAPFSKKSPMKVLQMTLEDDKKFSKSFKELVAACLQRDPKKRPAAGELLQYKFFERACGFSPLGELKDMLSRSNIQLTEAQSPPSTGQLLPSLGEHVDIIPSGSDEKQMKTSRERYMTGISSWNFGDSGETIQKKPRPHRNKKSGKSGKSNPFV